MCARLDSYLKSNNILCTNQFGFLKNSNTLDAIIEFLDYVYSSVDSKQSTIAVYLDFSRAFDTVNHNILMNKLLHNGILFPTGNNTSQLKTAVPLCQTLHCVFHKARC